MANKKQKEEEKRTAADIMAEIRALLDELEGASAESGAAEVVKFPASDEIDDLDDDAAMALAKKIGIETKGEKPKAIKKLLTTAAEVGEGKDEDDMDDDELDALCEALDIKPPKKTEAKIAAIKEYLESGDGGTEDAPDEDEKPAKKKKKDDDDAEEDEKPAKGKKKGKIDPEAIAAEADLPKEKVMIERLDAFNEACEKSDKIKFDEDDEDDVKTSYRLLLEKLVDAEGEIAEWGEPYVKDDSGYCCGLELEEVKIKGKKGDFGKCLVTEKVFEADDEGKFTEVED